MDRIRRLALLTTIATFLLITVGGFVRVAGAGLGCDSWPKCFPWSWLPPFSADQIPDDVDAGSISIAKAWIEWVNRLVGVAIGLLIVGTWWSVLRGARRRKDLLRPATAAMLLVGYQGWFGGQVVKHDLDPRLVSVHLFLALVIVILLVWVTIRAQEPAPRWTPTRELAPPVRRLGSLTAALLALATVQVVVGAVVRGTIENIARAAGVSDPAIGTAAQRAEWLAGVGLLDQIHRKGALLLLVLTVVMVLVRRRAEVTRRVAGLVTFNAAVVVGQVVAGLSLAYASLPPSAQLVHVTLGSWLVGGLFAQLVYLHARDGRSVLTDQSSTTIDSP